MVDQVRRHLGQGNAETYPAARITEELLETSSNWKDKHGKHGLEVKVKLKDYDRTEPGWVVDLKKLGNPKNLVDGFGFRVRVKVQDWVKWET